MLLTLSIFTLAAAKLAVASLSPTFPINGSVCAVSTDCQVKWVDTPAAPSAASMGETAIDLVTGDPGNLQIAQTLTGVSNPGVATALTFKPDSTLSPTAKYAIRFVPKSNPSGVIFSTFFTITGGDGTGKTIPTTSAGLTNSTSNSSTKSSSTASNSTTVAKPSNSTSGTLSSNTTGTTSPAAEKASSGSSTSSSRTISFLFLSAPVIALIL